MANENDRISVEIDIVEESGEFHELATFCDATGAEMEILSYSGVNGWPVVRLTGRRNNIRQILVELGYGTDEFLELEPHRRG